MEEEQVLNIEIESIDDFLPMPGADSIVTSSEPKNILSQDEVVDLSFMDEPVVDVITEITNEIDEIVEPTKSKPRTTATGNADVFKKLIDKNLLVPFDDGKELETYTSKDWEELLEANFAEKEKDITKKVSEDFFSALPEELQYAAQYIATGGTDLKGLFRVLSQTQETKSLDLADPKDHEAIVRGYLYAKNFGDEKVIEEQISEWANGNMLSKKAAQFKPTLDAMQNDIIKEKLSKQEDFKKQQLAKKEQYMNNIYETLKPGELNGIKLDTKRQKMLWDELTNSKYESLTGRPTNLLGKLLEEHQFGEKPRYDLIAEATWLLSDPEDYKANLKKNAINETVKKTVRELKTEEGRKNTTSAIEDEDKTPGKRTITRQTNIFQR
jgi:hypothetical protein